MESELEMRTSRKIPWSIRIVFKNLNDKNSPANKIYRLKLLKFLQIRLENTENENMNSTNR